MTDDLCEPPITGSLHGCIVVKANSWPCKKHDMFAQLSYWWAYQQYAITGRTAMWKVERTYISLGVGRMLPTSRSANRGHEKPGCTELIWGNLIRIFTCCFQGNSMLATHTHTIEIPQLKALCSNVCKRHRPDLPRILSFFFFLVPNEVLHENWMHFALVQAYHEEFAWRTGIVCSVIWLSSAFSANMFFKENECPMGVTTKDHNGT